MIELEEISEPEVEEFITLFDNLYHHNFNGYSRASLRRRILRLMRILECTSYAQLKFRLVNDDVDAVNILNEITVNTTEMFRDPEVFRFVYDQVFPRLDTYPQIKIWHAACSSGEEVYSVATLLNEANMLKKSIQYATDINSEVLQTAQDGIYNLKDMKLYTDNYVKSGGVNPFSDYYTANYHKAKLKSSLKKNVVFSRFDLINGNSFNEFQLIFCRNVLIYFNEEQQNAVIKLLIDSLSPYGYLVLGNKESIKDKALMKQLETVHSGYRIYKKLH